MGVAVKSVTRNHTFGCSLGGDITVSAVGQGQASYTDGDLAAKIAAENSARSAAEADAYNKAQAQANNLCNQRIDAQNNAQIAAANQQIAQLQGSVSGLSTSLASTQQNFQNSLNQSKAVIDSISQSLINEVQARKDLQDVTETALGQQENAILGTVEALNTVSETQLKNLESALEFSSQTQAGQAVTQDSALNTAREVLESTLGAVTQKTVSDNEKESKIATASIIGNSPVVRNLAISAIALGALIYYVQTRKK